jgi:hypothetical protein
VANPAEPRSLADHLDGVEAVSLLWAFVGADDAEEVVRVLAGKGWRIVYPSGEAAGKRPDAFWAQVDIDERDIAATPPTCSPSWPPPRQPSNPVTVCSNAFAGAAAPDRALPSGRRSESRSKPPALSSRLRRRATVTILTWQPM